ERIVLELNANAHAAHFALEHRTLEPTAGVDARVSREPRTVCGMPLGRLAVAREVRGEKALQRRPVRLHAARELERVPHPNVAQVDLEAAAHALEHVALDGAHAQLD